MSILSDMLNEEYERLLATINSFEEIYEEYPKGYITMKKIHGKEYPYLQWRDGNKFHSRYIKKDELEDIESSIKKRKDLERELKEMYESKKEFEKVINRRV